MMRVLLVADPPAADRWKAKLTEMGVEVEIARAEAVRAVHAGTAYVLAMNLRGERERVHKLASKAGARVISVPHSWAAASGVIKPVLDRLTIENARAIGLGLKHRPFEKLSIVGDAGAPPVRTAPPKPAPKVEPPRPEPKIEATPEPKPAEEAITRQRKALRWMLDDPSRCALTAPEAYDTYCVAMKAAGEKPIHHVKFGVLRHEARAKHGLPDDRAFWAGYSKKETAAARVAAARDLLESDVTASTASVVVHVRARMGLGLAPETIEKIRRSVMRRRQYENGNGTNHDTPPAQPTKEEPVQTTQPTPPPAQPPPPAQASDDLSAAIQLLAPIMRERSVRKLTLTLDPATGKIRAEWEVLAAGSVEV